MNNFDENFVLELLHAADQEASSTAVGDAPRFSAVLNGLRAQDLGDDGLADNTIALSSGDAFIPGVFFDASAEAFGLSEDDLAAGGIADIQIQNELGFEAISLGNHEFDFGGETLAALIDGSAPGAILGTDFQGAQFPYLATNLDFSTDADLAPLEVEGGGAPQPNTVTSSVVVDVNGENLAVVGATTPTLASISSPDDVTISPQPFDTPPSPEQLDALAADIQTEVDAVLAADPAINKVVLLAHMQQLSIEQQLATRLSGVDIVVAGGSNTRLFDENDRVRPGDSDQGEYPIFETDADGQPTLVVNTDGSYKYLGRLVIDFDENGNIVPESYDPELSGAFATDEEGVSELGAEDLVDPEVQAIADAIEEVIVARESNVFGISDVFLNGNRAGDADDPTDPDGVRTQETNLGNLTADANLALANQLAQELGESEPVVVSIKNGGGIRASIGESVVPPGGSESVRRPNPPIFDSAGDLVKPAGGVSQNDIQTTLAFNNGLTLLTLTRAELVAVLEHGVSALPEVAGQFPQVSGVEFAFDPDLPANDRIVAADIVDEAGDVVAPLVADGELVGDAGETFRIVTLGFLADGGDDYPFPTGPEADRVDLERDEAEGITGAAIFAADGTEQDALAEYLADNFATAETAFGEEDGGRAEDDRIANLEFQAPGAPVASEDLGFAQVAAFVGAGGADAAEVVAHEDGTLFVTNGEADRIDVFAIDATAVKTSPDRTIPLAGLEGFDGVQSVAVKNGVVAAAISRAPEPAFGGNVALSQPGFVALFDAETGELLATVDVGNLPDQLTFTPDGGTLLVAGEGEKNEDSENADDPLGTVGVVDVADPADPSVALLDFTSFDGLEDAARAAGIRIQEGVGFGRDVEPEYIAVAPDGTTAFVALQENNALAEIDLTNTTVVDVLPLGTVDFAGESALDPLDDGTIDIETVDGLVGLRMPDAIASYAVAGETYVVTANEGDGRDFDEARVAELVEDDRLDPALVERLTEQDLLDDDPQSAVGVERLEVSTIDGDTDGDGDIDVLHAFSSRSFSIFDAAGELVFDSGAEFERIIAERAPERFNDDDGADDEDRSDNKGPEPEAVTVGEVDGRQYAFIGLERDSGIMIYDVTTPAEAFFVDYIPPKFVDSTPDGEVARHSPEVVTFIAAEDSTTGNAQIAVAYEISGTTVVFDLVPADDAEGDGDAGDAGLVINEVLASHTGPDDTEFFELFGAPGASLAGLSLIGADSDVGRGGEIDSRFDFAAGDVIGDNGFFLVGNPVGLAENYGVTPDREIGADFFENSSATYALVETASLAGDAVTGDEVVLDAVAADDGEGDDVFFFDAPVLGPDGSFFPAGLRRVEDGVDTDTAADWAFADFALGDANTPTAGGDGGNGDGGNGGGNGGTPAPTATIMAIQGAGHVSPFVLGDERTAAEFFDALPADTFNITGEAVSTRGIVTAVDGRGFNLQDATGDGDDATSDALFVFTDAAPTVAVGDEVEVTGTVSEFFPGGTGTRNLPSTQLVGPAVSVISEGNDLPAATLLGQGGRVLPSESIDDDAFAAFEPGADGLDFFESVEGMRVTAQDTLAVAPTNRFGEVFTVVDQGADATGLSARGTLNIAPDDFNPEKVQIDFTNGLDVDVETPQVDVGALLGDVTGVIDYDFGNFQILPTEAVTVTPSASEAETTALTGGEDQLTVASYNVLNLDPNDADGDTDVADGRFAAIAQQIRDNLGAPDIVALQEVQNNDGEVISDVAAANETLQLLVDEIAAAGGPEYVFIDTPDVPVTTNDGELIRPVGGAPGGDIRNAFLYDPDRVDLVEGSVNTLGDGDGDAFPFFGGRIPLEATFAFDGEEVTLLNNHLSSKGGSAPILGIEQPFDERQEDPDVNGSLDQRRDQAEAVAARVEELLAAEADANVVVLGDLNEFEFVSPVDEILGENLTNLTDGLPEDERYSFIFQGNSQSLDHILASEALAEGAEFDVVHTNAEFAETDARASDHDPLVARFTIEAPEEEAPLLVGDAGPDTLIDRDGADLALGEGGPDILVGLDGNDSLFGGAGTDRLVGGDGDDLLDGGPGRDILIGGDGADQFALFDPGNFDFIVDFVAGEDTVLVGKNAGRDQLRVVDNGSGALLQQDDGAGDHTTLANFAGGAGLSLDELIGPADSLV
jgi:predicted extracellular nuclease/2',3'-cyclic-nucleotide 2'-phosphodiesterase (5'-nucleotidase family)